MVNNVINSVIDLPFEDHSYDPLMMNAFLNHWKFQNPFP